jgi:hypothetical protein
MALSHRLNRLLRRYDRTIKFNSPLDQMHDICCKVERPPTRAAHDHSNGCAALIWRPEWQCIFKEYCQKPSNARPIQLNANIEEAIAATDAKVAIVLINGITEPHVGR